MFGLLVKNIDGFEQISDDFNSVILTMQGWSSTPAWVNGSETVTISIPWTATPPHVYVRSTSLDVTFVSYQDSTNPRNAGNNYTVFSANSITIRAGPTAASFEFRVYARTVTTNPTSGFGMKVMNSSGVCVFNSQQGPLLRIIQTIVLSTNPTTRQYGSLAVGNGWVSLEPTAMHTPYGSGSSSPYPYGLYVNGTTLYIEQQETVNPYPVPTIPRSNFSILFLVAAD